MQAYKTDELSGLFKFSRPKAPAALGYKRLAAVHHGITGRTINGKGKVLSNFRIRVQRGESFSIVGLPLAQTQAFSFEFDKLGHIQSNEQIISPPHPNL